MADIDLLDDDVVDDDEGNQPDELEQLRAQVAQMSEQLRSVTNPPQHEPSPPPKQLAPRELLGYSEDEWEDLPPDVRPFAERIAAMMAERPTTDAVLQTFRSRDQYYEERWDPQAKDIQAEVESLKKDPHLKDLDPIALRQVARSRLSQQQQSSGGSGFPSTPSPRGDAPSKRVSETTKQRETEYWMSLGYPKKVAEEMVEREIKKAKAAR